MTLSEWNEKMHNKSKFERLAVEIIKDGKYGYLYGAKDIAYTKNNVDKLAKAYSYTKNIKKIALSNCNKYERAIDCSGYVCKCLGIPSIGSAQLYDTAVVKTTTQKKRIYNLLSGEILYKKGHVAVIVKYNSKLYICEAVSTAIGLRMMELNSFAGTSRYDSFTNVLVAKGSFLDDVQTSKPSENEYYPVPIVKLNSIVDALKSIGVDSSKDNRIRISAKNDIKNYRGTAVQNMELLSLLYKGILKKV